MGWCHRGQDNEIIAQASRVAMIVCVAYCEYKSGGASFDIQFDGGGD